MATVASCLAVVVVMGLLIWTTIRKWRPRSFVLVIALLHLLGAFAIPILLWVAVAFGKLYIVGTYEELDRNGAIDRARLREVRGGYFADKWSLSDDLGDHFDAVENIALAVSVFELATSTGLLAVWWGLRKQESLGGSEVKAPG